MSGTDPNLPHDDILMAEPPHFTPGQVVDFLINTYGLPGKISSLDSERDQNFLMVTMTGDQLVIEVSNPAMDPAVLEMQVGALNHIAQVDPELPVPRIIKSQNGLALEQVQAENGLILEVYVLTSLSGMYPRKDTFNQSAKC